MRSQYLIIQATPMQYEVPEQTPARDVWYVVGILDGSRVLWDRSADRSSAYPMGKALACKIVRQQARIPGGNPFWVYLALPAEGGIGGGTC